MNAHLLSLVRLAEENRMKRSAWSRANDISQDEVPVCENPLLRDPPLIPPFNSGLSIRGPSKEELKKMMTSTINPLPHQATLRFNRTIASTPVQAYVETPPIEANVSNPFKTLLLNDDDSDSTPYQETLPEKPSEPSKTKTKSKSKTKTKVKTAVKVEEDVKKELPPADLLAVLKEECRRLEAEIRRAKNKS